MSPIRATMIGQLKQVSLPPDQIGSCSITNLRPFLLDKKHARVGLKPTYFFREDIRNQAESSFELSAAKSTAYFLKHPTSHFMRPCNDDTTKRWMKETIRGSSIFLVVGFVTVTQAEVDRKWRTAKRFQAAGDVHITSLLSSGTGEIIQNGNISPLVGTFQLVPNPKPPLLSLPRERELLAYNKEKFTFACSR